ncbi:MAG: hypothetical protein GWN99_20085 [Gemmatimonadetes bacterium]|uniref:BIG2 domain-containing protein n=1 Tax=Candidatus Kutchimonas denitrificans TaxID=3056748 RepID=A0AAE4ZAR2_9BACT|nr:hypothetical protein [Gemmatimonadota bacterium]NIR76504.1 hypothetical protein [Candidatus Kutchimonas denitrificans]NIS03322.1 hypothetical protein [Gemmatimonadota bacterium]NIT69183.1 hypothetical protein [Gemmatimonadota bacterium]NIU54575.1 hypothetical protein [Gemmatimonadota bacterium]
MRGMKLTMMAVLAVLAMGCGGDDATGPDAIPVASVIIEPNADTIIAGEQLALSATLLSADGDTIFERSPEWSSPDTLIATVSASGMVTGVGRGLVEIVAKADDAADTASVRVNEGPDPSLTSLEPDHGTVGTEIRLIGEHFRTDARVFLDGLESDSVDIVNDTLIFALAPPGLTAGVAYDVTIRNRDSTFAELTASFAAVAPDLDFVNGASKPSGKVGSTVVIDGDAFGDLRGVGKVLFSDGVGGSIEATIASEDDWTNTFILTTVPSGAETGDLVVVTATGTSNALTFTVTQEASFSPSSVDWSQTTDLPVGVSGHAAVRVPTEPTLGSTVHHVHLSGGASNDSVPRVDVAFSIVQSDGSLGAWTGTTPLPAARAFHASVAATPFNSRVLGEGWLYALGGIEAKGGDPVATVLRAPINADGTLGSWSQTTSLPDALHSLEAIVFRSNIYIAGGARVGNEPVTTVYRAPIDTLGRLGAWKALASLPGPRSYHQLTVIGNCLHIFDGDSAAVNPNDNSITASRVQDIVRTRIDLRSGDLVQGGWLIDGTLPPKARSKHTAIIAGGGVLRSGGLYDGLLGTLGSSENMFAQIAADCDVSDFNGANNNRSIATKGGGNLFNHAAITYIDPNGVAHVMILGGDDADNPGAKRKAVWVF